MLSSEENVIIENNKIITSPNRNDKFGQTNQITEDDVCLLRTISEKESEKEDDYLEDS
jgi:hypothetical protein